MGYLQIASTSLPTFSKAVISLWFRIPEDVLTTVSALTDSPSDTSNDGWSGICFSPVLYKIIPLITFGSLETGLGDESGVPVQPSFIGVDCSYVGSGYPARVAVNLQTSNTCSFNKPPTNPDAEVRPECYYMNGYGYNTGSHALTVTGDAWHHILISFDISPSCSITYANGFRSPPDDIYSVSTGPTFSWAFDDVDKVDLSIEPSGSGGNNWGVGSPGETAGDRHILPNGFFNIWVGSDTTATPIEDSTDFQISLAAGSIVSFGNPIGIPTSSAFVDNVYNIEMAEVQIFTGVTLDTSDEESRRAFIKSDGTPQLDYSLAVSLLGKSPEIKLSGSSAWLAGTNSGSLSENFIRTGTINAYSTSQPNISP